MISEAQLLANRTNGAKSRGPLTDEGKVIASRNAIQHGLLAKTDILVPGETEDDLKAFTDALRADLLPQGATEEMLFDRIVSCAWRLKRAAKIETSLLKWYVYQEFTQGSLDRINDCFFINRYHFPNAPLINEKGLEEAGSEEMAHRKKRDAQDTGLGRAFIRSISEEDAMTKLSRYERGLERSFLRSLWGLQEAQRARRKAKDITPQT
jgi:hypothetical protein